MTEPWPTQPGQQPPLPPGGAPPLRGQPAPVAPTATSWSGGDAPLPPPTPPRWDRGRILLVVAAVVVVALVSSLVTFWLTADDGGDEAATASSTTATTEPGDPAPSTTGPGAAPSTTAPPSSLTEEELLAEVAELSAFVESQRGGTFAEPVAVELLDDAEFEERLLATIDEDIADIETQGKILSALGLIEPEVDIPAATEKILGQGVLGFYETEDDELVVRGTDLTPYTRQTIVHELVHAYDDQAFELFRPEYDERDDEIGQGFSSILEGNARRVEEAWVDTLSPAERDERNREEALYGLNADLEGVPLVLLELLVSPYEDGLVLVQELADLGGEPLIDQAIETPPTSTEQVLLPEKYLVLEDPLPVEVPEADGEVIDQGTFGMLLWQILLEDVVTPSQAFRAAEGWGGDRYVAWDSEDGACVRIDVEMDTAADASDLVTALEQYTFEHDNVTVTERGATGARVDACTPPPEGGGGGSQL